MIENNSKRIAFHVPGDGVYVDIYICGIHKFTFIEDG